MSKVRKLKELKELLNPKDHNTILVGQRYFDEVIDDNGELVNIEREKETVYVSGDTLKYLGFNKEDPDIKEVKLSLKEWEAITGEGCLAKITFSEIFIAPRHTE